MNKKGRFVHFGVAFVGAWGAGPWSATLRPPPSALFRGARSGRLSRPDRASGGHPRPGPAGSGAALRGRAAPAASGPVLPWCSYPAAGRAGAGPLGPRTGRAVPARPWAHQSGPSLPRLITAQARRLNEEGQGQRSRARLFKGWSPCPRPQRGTDPATPYLYPTRYQS